MIETFDSQNIRALVRRLNVFQAWRLGEPPFQNRGDLFSESDVNTLLDEVAACLSHCAEHLSDTPTQCTCSSKQQVRSPFGFLTDEALKKMAAEESARIAEAIKAGKLLPSKQEAESFNNHGGFIVNG